MRLATGTVIAAALHGVVFGVVAAVLSGPSAAPTPPVSVEIELVSARPDPVAEASPGAADPTPAPEPRRRPPPRRPERHLPARPQVALAKTPGPVDSTPEPGPPAGPIEPAAPSGPPSPAEAAGPAIAGGHPGIALPSTGAVVSARPRYRSNPKPAYPIPSQRRREEGIVYLKVVVQTDGLPAAISLDRSCGHPLLDRAALEAVRHWTFEPARAAGVPVSSMVVVPIRFFLSEQP